MASRRDINDDRLNPYAQHGTRPDTPRRMRLREEPSGSPRVHRVSSPSRPDHTLQTNHSRPVYYETPTKSLPPADYDDEANFEMIGELEHQQGLPQWAPSTRSSQLSTKKLSKGQRLTLHCASFITLIAIAFVTVAVVPSAIWYKTEHKLTQSSQNTLHEVRMWDNPEDMTVVRCSGNNGTTQVVEENNTVKDDDPVYRGWLAIKILCVLVATIGLMMLVVQQVHAWTLQPARSRRLGTLVAFFLPPSLMLLTTVACLVVVYATFSYGDNSLAARYCDCVAPSSPDTFNHSCSAGIGSAAAFLGISSVFVLLDLIILVGFVISARPSSAMADDEELTTTAAGNTTASFPGPGALNHYHSPAPHSRTQHNFTRESIEARRSQHNHPSWRNGPSLPLSPQQSPQHIPISSPSPTIRRGPPVASHEQSVYNQTPLTQPRLANHPSPTARATRELHLQKETSSSGRSTASQFSSSRNCEVVREPEGHVGDDGEEMVELVVDESDKEELGLVDMLPPAVVRDALSGTMVTVRDWREVPTSATATDGNILWYTEELQLYCDPQSGELFTNEDH